MLRRLLEILRDNYGEDGISPEKINNGFCADFATRIWEQMPDVRVVSDEDMGAKYTHTFIEHDGLYYDSECVEGVEDWTQLPTFHRTPT